MPRRTVPDYMLTLSLQIFLKLFFLLTPFCVLSTFVSMTKDFSPGVKRTIAFKTSLAILVTTFCLYFFGTYIFNVFGITLDAFRIGAGAVLFLSALGLVRGEQPVAENRHATDIAVVPLAIPLTVGPATTGALMVMGAEVTDLHNRLAACFGLIAAVLSVGLLLLAANVIERILGRQGIMILSKITGLLLASLAAQIIFTGLKSFIG